MILKIENVSKVIRQNEIIKHVSLEMSSGKIYGFQGKNGSGKTMLMRMICGLVFPTTGKVIINDQQIGKDISFPQNLGALIENPDFIANYNAFKNLRTLADINDKLTDEQIRDVLVRVALDPASKVKFKEFSLGMKQKLGIAAALMEKPSLLILDEPFNALDEEVIPEVKKMILERKEAGAICILSCHDREELEELCDEIYQIDLGNVKHHLVKRNGIYEEV